MFTVIDAATADEAWHRLCHALSQPFASEQASRVGGTREVLRTAVSITDPRQRWVASRTPPLNPAFAVAELIWMITGRNDSAFVNFFNPQLPRFAGAGATYHGAYGYRLCRSHANDQLARAASALRAQPDSRQVVLQIWDSTLDLPREDGSPAAPDIPCNIFAMLKIRNGLLEWTQVSRSNDLFRGLPYDIAVFTMLHEVLSGWCGAGLGSYNVLSDSMHLYLSDSDALNSLTGASCPRETEQLDLCERESRRHVAVIERLCDAVISRRLSAKMALSYVEAADVPVGYQSLLRVVAADACRRLGAHEIAADIMSRCTSASLRFMWNRWAGAKKCAGVTA